MATVTTEDIALSTKATRQSELVPASGAAERQAELQLSISVAQRFNRSEDQAFGHLMIVCDRSSFADEAIYSFPRGTTLVEGPSVKLAREAARIWGHLRYGLEIIRDDEDSRLIRGYAWDLQTNVRIAADDEFQKLIQRKGRNGGIQWVKPDEREMRELTNRRGAILTRNCLLQVMPTHLIEDAMIRCKATMKKGVDHDPAGARKKLILAFASLNITADMLEAKLGHPLGTVSPAELADLRSIYKSIFDGNSSWPDYLPKPEPEKATLTPADITAGTEPNRGHGDENLKAVGKPKKATPAESVTVWPPEPEPES